MRFSKIITARSTVISLICAISVALLFASAVPQRASLGKTPPWVERLPDDLRVLSSLLGLDNVVGSGWFAALVALFWVSLVVSAVSQYKAAKALVYRLPQAAAPREGVRLDTTAAAFAELAERAGYRPAGSVDGSHRFVKNRIGYWGNFLLHLGIITAVFFSLVYVLTQHRVLVRLAGNEITRLSSENVQEVRGMMTGRQRLPYSVVLMNLKPRFWGNDKLEHLSSELYVTAEPGGDPQRVDVALSDKAQYGPFIVYQANAFGRVFDLDVASPRGEIHRVRLYLPYPPRRDMAGYGEMPLAGTDFVVKGKFYADAERKTMALHDPPLTLRLYRGKDLQGEVTLTPAITGQLGPLSVRLVQSQWWTDILLDGTRGMAGIFAGFALILAGVFSSYFLVPREIIAREAEGGLHVQHVARRFAQFYAEEFAELMGKAGYRGEI